jgi:hypothetical protein
VPKVSGPCTLWLLLLLWLTCRPLQAACCCGLHLLLPAACLLL